MTATWHIAMLPTVPLYCGAAPAQSEDDFSSAVSSTMSITSSSSWPAVRCAAAQVCGGVQQLPLINADA